MTRLLRRLRGALGIGVAWGIIWIAIGAIIFAVISMVHPEDIGPGEGPGRALAILGSVGFLSGVAFATLLSLTERRSTFRDLSLWRVALWGVAGGAAIPVLIGANPSLAWETGTLGAISAVISLLIARRGAARRAEERSPA